MNIIKKKLEEIICDQQNNAPLGLLYSGGLDSTIIASLMTKCLPFSSFNLVSVGFPESYDIKNASLGARVLGVNHHKCYLSIEIIRETINSLKHLKVIHNPIHLTIALPLYLGLQMMSERCHTRTVFMGQGADELFCGYKRYSLMYEEDKIDQIETVMSDDLKSLMEKQVKMETSLANHFNVSLVYPYLDPEIIEVAKSFPIVSQIISTQEGIIRKVLLRKLAKQLGLPDIITKQQKKAIQYGSGTVKSLRKLIKEQGYSNIHDWFYSWFKLDSEQ